MQTYTVQSPGSTLFFMAIPLVVAALLWLADRHHGEYYRSKYSGARLHWARWGSSLLISLLVAVPFYFLLFWQPFYSVTVASEGTVTLVYELPRREVTLQPDDIATLTVEDDNIPAFVDNNRPRQRLVLTTTTGDRYVSMLAARAHVQRLLTQLAQPS